MGVLCDECVIEYAICSLSRYRQYVHAQCCLGNVCESWLQTGVRTVREVSHSLCPVCRVIESAVRDEAQ